MRKDELRRRKRENGSRIDDWTLLRLKRIECLEREERESMGMEESTLSV